MKLKATLALGLLKCIGCLPLRVNRAIGYSIGWLLGVLPTREKRISQANIAHCYPTLDQKQQCALLKASLKHSAMTFCEIPWVWHQPYSVLAKHILEISGIDHLQALQQNPEGGIVIGPHIGNWEVAGHVVTATIGKTMTLYRPPKLPELEPMIIHGRSKTGNEILPASVRGVSGLLKHLRQGGVTCVLPDQLPDAATAGVYAPFFGQPALTMTLISNLVAKTGCNCIYVIVKRVKGGFHVIFEPSPVGLDDDSLEVSAAALNKGVEQSIAHCPEQYQWAYKRFRRQQSGIDIYKKGA